MHAISHVITPRCLSCTQRTQMGTLNSFKGVSSQAWLQQPLRKNPCRSNDRRNDEQGQTDARGSKWFSLKPGAVSRYYLTAEYRAVHQKTLRDMICQVSSKLPHPDMWGPRIRKDEADIKSLVDLMESNWVNPLYPDESYLVSLSTGTLATPAVVKDLLRALEVGEETYQTFKWTRLDDDPPSVKFHDKTAKQRLKTFSTISTKTSRMKGQNVVLKAYRNLFSQMILVAESISVNMKDVLAHKLGPLP